ncbi:TPA: sulfate ABC transporter permease [Vibrio parahaemolyticus]|nr:sulfate ABC transporter permease [Vibrio parahaemolyticus]
MKRSLLAVLISSVAFPILATVELTDNLSLSGFGSIAWAQSDNETSLLVNRFIDDDSCFDCDTTFGLQLDYFYQAFRASVQVVKRPQDHWSEPKVEWAYLAYTYNNVEIRGGRLRLPVFLISEYNYVGQAFTTARPPNEVYDSILGITAYDGLSFRWNYDLNENVMITAMPFVGYGYSSDVTISEDTDISIDTNYSVGLNLTLSGDNYRWNFAHLNAEYDQTTVLSNAMQPILGQGSAAGAIRLKDEDQHIQLFSLGAKYEFDRITVTAEGQTSDISTSWYAATSYNLNKFTPYVVYGQQFDDNEKKTGDSVLTGLRFDVDYNVSVNAEWQHFKAFNNDSGAFSLPPADTNANLYTVMLNFVF